jgi:hypothetical protein
MNLVKLTKIYDSLKTIELLKKQLDKLHTEHLKVFVDESINNTKLRRSLYFTSSKLLQLLNKNFEEMTITPK